MKEITVNRFRSSLKTCVDTVNENHEPLWVTRKGGDDFVVVGANDWEQLHETVQVLQDSSLMSQIRDSLKTHQNKKGYRPSLEELNEIDSF